MPLQLQHTDLQLLQSMVQLSQKLPMQVHNATRNPIHALPRIEPQPHFKKQDTKDRDTVVVVQTSSNPSTTTCCSPLTPIQMDGVRNRFRPPTRRQRRLRYLPTEGNLRGRSGS